ATTWFLDDLGFDWWKRRLRPRPVRRRHRGRRSRARRRPRPLDREPHRRHGPHRMAWPTLPPQPWPPRLFLAGVAQGDSGPAIQQFKWLVRLLLIPKSHTRVVISIRGGGPAVVVLILDFDLQGFLETDRVSHIPAIHPVHPFLIEEMAAINGGK